jgi:hypothetical protein
MLFGTVVFTIVLFINVKAVMSYTTQNTTKTIKVTGHRKG